MAIELGSAHGAIYIDSKGVTSGTQKATSDLQKFEQGFGKVSKGIVKIAGGITAEIKMLEKAFAFGEAGANLEYTRAKFDRMATAIGSSGERLLEKLKTVTRGMVSESELVESALNFMALGLVKNEDEAVRLTKIAGALNMNMNQLVLTLTNQTTMRFDALGVAVDGFDEKVAALKKTGMDTNAAFTEAFLQQAEDQIARVGEVADSSVAPFKRLEVATKDLGDMVKISLADPLADAAEGLALMLTYTQKLNSVYEDHENEVVKTAASYDEYINEMLRAADVTGKLGKFHIYYNQIIGNPTATRSAARELGLLTEMQWKAARSDEELVKRYGEWSTSMTTATKTVEEATLSVEQQEQVLNDLNLFMKGELGAEIENFISKQGELKTQAQEYKDKIDELNGLPYLTQEQRDELIETKSKYADIEEQIKANAAEHEKATKQILFNLLAQQLATSDAAAVLPLLAEKWGLIDSATAQAYGSIQNIVQAWQDGKLTLEQFIEKMGLIVDKTIYVDVIGRVSDNLQPFMSANQFEQSGRVGTGIVQTPRALGGPVWAGHRYRWQEQSIGDEILLTMRNGNVLTASQVDKLINGNGASAQLTQLSGIVQELASRTPVTIQVLGPSVRDEADLEAWAYRTREMVVQQLGGR